MLILHPSSACDICIEPFVLEATYPNYRRAPCVIECGHVFCDSCLDSFQQAACPLCRTPFDEHLIRKIHIDIKPLLPSDRSPMPTVPEQLEAEKHRIKDRLTAMMRDGASGRERETVLNEAKDWLRKNDPHEEHAWDLRGPYLLVVRYQDLNKENQSALMDAHESRKQHEEMRILLAEQTEAAEDEIDSLRHALVEERAKAAAVEKSLKDHNYRVEIAWTQKYEDVLSEVRALREELRFFSGSSRRDRYDDYDGHRSHASRRDPPLAIRDDDPPPVDTEMSDALAHPDEDADDRFAPLSTHLSPLHTALTTLEPRLCRHNSTGEDDDRAYYKPRSRRDSEEPMDYDRPDPRTASYRGALSFARLYDAADSGAPPPAAYYNKRHEKHREHGAALTRNHSACSSTSGRSEGRVGRLRQAAQQQQQQPPEASDIEVERRVKQLDDILADPPRVGGGTPVARAAGAELHDAGEYAAAPVVQQELPAPAPAPARSAREHREREHVQGRREREREQPTIYVERTVEPAAPAIAPAPAPALAPALQPVPAPAPPKTISHASAAAEAIERERAERRRRESGSRLVNAGDGKLRDATNAYVGEDGLRKAVPERRPSGRYDGGPKPRRAQTMDP